MQMFKDDYYDDDYYDDGPTLIEQLIEEKRRKGLLPKTSYTKDEVIAMLEEIQLEIEEDSWTRECLDGSDETIVDMRSVNEVFQQKINKLKGETKR